MTPASIAALALLFGLIPGPYKSFKTQAYAQDGWLLTVHEDTFNHTKTCQLETQIYRRPGVTVEAQALAFHFNPRLDTDDAWYAVDGRAPKAWRDHGLQFSTHGAVVLPMADVAQAHVITVRPTPDSRPHDFDLKNLWPILASAEALGCRFADGSS